MIKDPKVSVLMGIYNCEKTLSKAIDSIIAQTYSNWELILCDDGSTDSSYQIAENYRKIYPDRIVLLRNHSNQGLNITLNNCFFVSTGELIARQDADDISLPMRFEKEVDYLSTHPDCSFVSCGIIICDGERKIGMRFPSKKRPLAKDFMRTNPFYHAPVIIRREALETVGAYSENRRLLRVEDYNLWTKLYAAGFFGENIQEAYYEVLEDENAYKRRRFSFRINEAHATMIAVDMLGLPKWNKIFALRGILVGLLPAPIYRVLHRKRLLIMNKGLKPQQPTGGEL